MVNLARMNGRGLAAILAAAALAAGAGMPAPARAAAPGKVAPGKAAPGATTVPCPKADPGVVPNHPPRAKAPADDPVLRAVGGAALDTDGLAAPDGAPAPPALTATSWLVADLDSGAVLGGCGPHVHGTPASVQKLLLAATALPKLDANQQMTVTSEDLKIERGSSAVGLLVGGHYPIETLWLGLLLNSGNDAANALARLAGGDGGVAATLTAMNAKAHELGAFQTHAATPSGLDGPGQFTSAYDLALIARECFARDDFRKYALTPNATIPAQPPKTKTGFQIQNENTLIFKYAGALGGKTGFTDLARHTYVGAAERGGRRLVATVLGAEARPLRGWQQGAALLDWGFSLPRDARVGELVPPGTDPRAPSPTPKPAEAVEAAPATLTGGGPAASPIIIAAGVALFLAGAPIALVVNARRRRRIRYRRRRNAR